MPWLWQNYMPQCVFIHKAVYFFLYFPGVYRSIDPGNCCPFYMMWYCESIASQSSDTHFTTRICYYIIFHESIVCVATPTHSSQRVVKETRYRYWRSSEIQQKDHVSSLDNEDLLLSMRQHAQTAQGERKRRHFGMIQPWDSPHDQATCDLESDETL